MGSPNDPTNQAKVTDLQPNTLENLRTAARLAKEQQAGNASAATSKDAATSSSPQIASAATPTAASGSSLTGSTVLSGSNPNGGTNTAAEKADASFVNDPVKAQSGDPLAGTSKVLGNNNTGMMAGMGDTAPKKAVASQPTNVNVGAPGAPHPIENLSTARVGELRELLNKMEQSPFVIRAKTDLEAVDGWIKQHFAELKRKL